MAKLILTLDGVILNQYFIDKPCIRIGSDAENEIVIDDVLLGARHARIVTVGQDQIVEDLNSEHGTRVNGRTLMRQILKHSDVIELGSHHLRYMSSRLATDADLERTMLIEALPRHGKPAPGTPPVSVPLVRAARARLPDGSVKVLAGSGRHAAGESVRLDRVVATFGIPGEQLIVIARRPQGYFLTHVEGASLPLVNGQRIGGAAHRLGDGDRIEAAGFQLEFRLASPD